MTAQRPDRPVSVRDEVALAEARDLPPRADGDERRLHPVAADILEAKRRTEAPGRGMDDR